MNNEERILEVLKQIIAGQAKLEFGQTKLETGQIQINARLDKLEAGQTKLETGQIQINARLDKLEAGQSRLETELKELKAQKNDDNAKLANIIMDVHESAEKHYEETLIFQKEVMKRLKAIEHLTTRNVLDIAELQAAAAI